MDSFYCFTAWDFYKGEIYQQHITHFNSHTQHLLFFRPTPVFKTPATPTHIFHSNIVGGEISLRGLVIQ